ncbi:MAG: outer membrane protein assembly factor BamD [Candidatus Zixiibacteriota bacterium]|nr:MAG: outer membrane protein assembly factor BamD [candidate division Zixibacteria bacterium]
MALKRSFIAGLILAGLLGALSGCGRVQVEEAMSQDDMWALARSYFESGDYLDAIDVLSIFTLNYSGSTRIDSAQYLLAESHFALGEYILAESEYQRLADNLPQSPLVDEARLKIILANVYMSPAYSHDQKFTERALAAAQDFREDYTQTDFGLRLAPRNSTWESIRRVMTLGLWQPKRKDVTEIPLFQTKVVQPDRSRGFGTWLLRVLTFGLHDPPPPEGKIPPSTQAVSGDWVAQKAYADTRARLARKVYESGALYYKQDKFPSAVIYFDRVLDLYPETPWAEPALLGKADSFYNMERYADAARTYQLYLQQFGPEGKAEVREKLARSLEYSRRQPPPEPPPEEPLPVTGG